MKKVNIMNYKIFLYIVLTFLSIFGVSAINYEKFIKANKVWETRILLMLLSMSLAYLVTNFIIDFTNLDSLF